MTQWTSAFLKVIGAAVLAASLHLLLYYLYTKTNQEVLTGTTFVMLLNLLQSSNSNELHFDTTHRPVLAERKHQRSKAIHSSVRMLRSTR